MSKIFDVLIIGGGPAGLSIATALARQVFSALIIDSGTYRNDYTQHMYNVPSFDHVRPADFRAKVRADLTSRYDTVEFESATVEGVKKLDSGVFEVRSREGGVYRGRKLALGTGVRDVFGGMAEGYEECWGRSIFHCLFCHGYEERGAESAGLLAGGFLVAPEMLRHVALMAKRLCNGLTIYTDDNEALMEQLRPLINSTKISFDNRKITRFQLRPGQDAQPDALTLRFADGTTKHEGFLASHPSIEQRAAPFIEQLGLETTPTGDIKLVSGFNETSVEGCFAAGDAATWMRSVVQAMQMGMFAGSGLVAQLGKDLDVRDEI
ncbi:Thioredoxin reductase gliT [Cladobotryum mycophilum]|uniref:Thioredoxin reductase gliT n=1 Tax=Cladobotryum mycophilum TaxID=491253 RepID=A0ABR0SDU7_9HYPO